MPVIHGAAASEAAMMGRQTRDRASLFLFFEFRLDDVRSKCQRICPESCGIIARRSSTLDMQGELTRNRIIGDEPSMNRPANRQANHIR